MTEDWVGSRRCWEFN